MSQLVRKLSIWRQTSSHGHWLSARPAHCRPIDKWPRPLEVHHVCHPQSFSLLKASGVTMRASLVAGQHEIDTVTECHTLPKHQTATYIYIYLYIYKMQSRPCWKASSKVSAEYSAHLVPLSLSLFLFDFFPQSQRAFLDAFWLAPTLIPHCVPTPPSSKMPRSKPKLTRAVSQAKKSSNVFSWLCFSNDQKKICHSTWQLLFGKLWENKTVNMESSWELRGGDDAKNLQWGTGWGQTNVELSR